MQRGGGTVSPFGPPDHCHQFRNLLALSFLFGRLPYQVRRRAAQVSAKKGDRDIAVPEGTIYTCRMHPQIRQEFEAAYAVWWEKVPYSLGAYGRTPSTELRERLSQPDGRIYLASAGTSTRPAWLEGAVQAAWRTVESLHERAMKS